MKCILISCFNIYDLRIRPIENFLIAKGYECKYITSDFDHNKKAKYASEHGDAIQLNVPKYKKNLSIARLLSHYIFAKKAIKEIKRQQPDLIYVILPPNFLAKFFSRYKRKNKVQLVYDIYDLWPETFPSKKSKGFLTLPFLIWRNIRDKNLSSADMVITECNLFQEKLKKVLNGVKKETLYLSKDSHNINNIHTVEEIDKLNLCYLGSINNIIDIDLIKNVVREFNNIKPVTLHVIGDGENRIKLIEEIREVGAEVEFYGLVYNVQEKTNIFKKCHFGINIMKDSVCVGLTMKSIDYFQAGLPILNNIQEDTFKLVDKYSIGFNINQGNLQELVKKVSNLNVEDHIKMRQNTKKIFKDFFSTEAANKKLEYIFEKIGI
ncbi:glycosyltransferase [Rossellomorea marisflavi]|uniref:glycosyltransferase n=1 Tax=Rossellomorea marisflavi TaxID=189381 RepID=UPI00345D6C51